jgi:hypothetical protein
MSEAAAGELLDARVGWRLDDDAVGRPWGVCAGNPLLLE